jgi:hypothetical protein
MRTFLISLITLFAWNLSAEETKTPAQPEPFQSFSGKVIGNKVRLRAASNTQSAIIQDLNKNDLVLVVGEENEFYAVQPFAEHKLFVFRSYLLDNVVEAHRVNVRLKPSTEAPIVGVLSQNEKVQGIISPENSKWLELTIIPEHVRFYVAKEFITKEGDPSIYLQINQKKKDALAVLNNAQKLAKAETKKSFNEMAPESITNQLEMLVKDYSEFPSIVDEAKKTMKQLNKTYQTKKHSFLDNQKNLKAPPVVVAQIPEKAKQEEVNNPVQETKPVEVDAMNFWKPVEDALFATWSSFHPEKTTQEFYAEQEANSTLLSGVVEPYDSAAKNKPGNYVLKNEDKIVAFLYSTQINLQEFVGKSVNISASPRANNNFAFPAYYVISVQ